MAYSTTLDQKRRETLRRQLYGKEVITSKKGNPSVSKQKREENQTHSTFSYTNNTQTLGSSDLHSQSYVSRDLIKILIFSVIAIAAQLTLYFAINNHLVKLPI